MPLPDQERVRELLGWRPELGVISVCAAIDPAERGGGWRIAVADELRAVGKAAEEESREQAIAARATVERALTRIDGAGAADGRARIGFLEVSRDPAEELWFSSAGRPRRTVATRTPRPLLQPLVELIDDHRRIGVAVVSSEEARMLEWEEEVISELDRPELVISADERERRAPRAIDPARAQVPTSSGRDQHEQHMEANRRRFVEQLAVRISSESTERGWSEIAAFGERKYLSELREALGDHRLAHVEGKNLIRAPLDAIAERMRALAPELNRRREAMLVERVRSATMSGNRGALGPQEVAQALTEGRVEHLLIASGADLGRDAILAALAVSEPGDAAVPTSELLIERAIATGAAVTPVEGGAAEMLASHGAVGALLRY